MLLFSESRRKLGFPVTYQWINVDGCYVMNRTHLGKKFCHLSKNDEKPGKM